MRRPAVTECAVLFPRVLPLLSPFVSPLIWIESGTLKSEIERAEGDLVKERGAGVSTVDGPIMIPASQTFHPLVPRSEGGRRGEGGREGGRVRFHSDPLDCLQAGANSPKDFPETSEEPRPSSSSFPSAEYILFSLAESECKGRRNEEGTSVHDSRTSSPSASARLSRLRSVTVVRLLCFPSFARHSSFRGRTGKKESRGADSSARPSSDITFILFRALLAGPSSDSRLCPSLSRARADPFIFESFRIIALVLPART